MTVRIKSLFVILAFLAGGACVAGIPLVGDLPVPWDVDAGVILRALPWAILVLGLLALFIVRHMYASRLKRVQTIASAGAGSDIPGMLAAMPQDEIGRIAHELSVSMRQAERNRRDVLQSERDILAAQRRVGILIETLPMALLVADEQGRIAQMNRYAGRLIGWKPQDALRKPIALVFPEPFRRSANEERVFQELRERLRQQTASAGGVAFRVVGRSAAGVDAIYHVRVQELAGGSRTDYLFLVRPHREATESVGSSQERVEPASDTSITSAPDAPLELEPIRLSVLVDAVVKEVHAAAPDSRRRLALMGPASVTAHAHERSVRVVLREMIDAALDAALPSAVVNVTITETGDWVGVMAEAPVAIVSQGAVAPPPLVFASEVARALGGSLEVYSDIPGRLQIMLELQRASS